MFKVYVVLLALLLGLLLVACGQRTATQPPRPSTRVLPATLTRTPRPTSTRRPTRSPTISPTVTLTLSATHTFTPTITPTPENSPTLGPFPMAIEVMRQGEYPGSAITVVDELAEGSNYRRYYVYYLSEGLKIYALLTVPNAEMPEAGWPGIVFNHGYIPPDEYRTTERYIDYVDRLARRDYVIFRIDYRGHDASEGDPQGAYGDPGYLVDVLNALASLKSFPVVNPGKIGVWGHSMGGYLALRAMVISQDIKAGVIWAGVVADYPDLLYKWNTGPLIPPANSRRWRDDWVAQFGTPEQNPAFWASISANSYLADLSGPLQLHHGTRDLDVPPEFSATLAEQVQAVGRDVEWYEYPGDNHNLTNYFNLAIDRSIEFFDRYLK